MASAYKWRLKVDQNDNVLYSYLFDSGETTDNPVVNSGYPVSIETTISDRVSKLTREQYSEQFDKMNTLVSTYDVELLPYQYYYDMGEDSCGFLQGNTGPQGARGEQGEKGEKGDQGTAGRSLSRIDITPMDDNRGYNFRIYYQDPYGEEEFHLYNGLPGDTPSVDYGFILSGITKMNIEDRIFNRFTEDMTTDIEQYFQYLFSGATSDINEALALLQKLQQDYAGLNVQYNSVTGTLSLVGLSVSESDGRVTTLETQFSSLSGVVRTDMESINTLSGIVMTTHEETNAISGYMESTLNRIDEVNRAITGFSESVNIVEGEYARMLYDLTTSADGTQVLTCSEIFQSVDTISMVTSGGPNNLAASLIMTINGDTSEAKLSADKLKLIGEDIEFGAENGIHSKFLHDGSGYLCGNKIHWDNQGNFTIENNALIDSCTINDCTISAATIEEALIKNCTAHDLLVNGSFRSPFSVVNSPRETIFCDNVVVISNNRVWDKSYNLPWDVGQTGRRITIVNYKWDSSIAEGWAEIKVPDNVNAHFFEDGAVKDTLNMSRQAIELLGYGTSTEFYGWIVLNRIDIAPDHGYGHDLKWLATGTVTVSGTRENPRTELSKYVSFDGTTLSVERQGVGIYKVTWGTECNWFADDADVFVQLTGFGTALGEGTVIGADLYEKHRGYMIVYTSDDATNNDGSFMFVISNLNDGTILLPHA